MKNFGMRGIRKRPDLLCKEVWFGLGMGRGGVVTRTIADSFFLVSVFQNIIL